MAYDEKIRIGIDTREVIRGIDKLSKKLRGVEGMGKINARNFTQPLGQITGKANEFTKSMEAANARVLAFGAAAGTIYQVQRAFQALVTSTIEVEYSLKRINTLLKQTTSNQSKTSNDLFRIAKQTGASFEDTAKAMEEFARQGLGAAQAAKRTRDAMILVRLSGMDATSAVMGLTAAINGFNKVGLDSTTVLNKMSTVAAKFAVSERDLADAVRRVGSTAVDAKVSFDELMGVVAAAQQMTARGGAVIGNSFKTIFTRLQRLRNVRALEELNIQVRDLKGNMLPAVQVLKNLAGEFDNLKDAEKAQVSELIGGVFQINVLKAVLKDLGNAHGLAARATKISTNATNEAIQKNKELNDTLKAMMNETMNNFVQMSAQVGKLTLEKPAKNLMKIFNTMLKAGTPGEAEGFGSKMGRGILKGFGDFLGGPGLVLLAGVVGKLMAKFTMFAVDSIRSMTAQGKAMERRAMLEREIIQLLTTDQGLVNMIEKETVDVAKVQERVLMLINQQIAATETLAAVSRSVAPIVAGRGLGARPGGGIGKSGGKSGISAGGFVPRPEKLAERAGAFAGGYTPGRVTSMQVPRFGKLVYNTNETVKQFPGFAQPAVLPPQGSPAAGTYRQSFRRAHGFNPYSPNFAKKGRGPAPINLGSSAGGFTTLPSTKGALLVGSGMPKLPITASITSTTEGGINPVTKDKLMQQMRAGKHPRAMGRKLGSAFVTLGLGGGQVRTAFNLKGGPQKAGPTMTDELKGLDNAMLKFASNVNNQMFTGTKASQGQMRDMDLDQATRGNIFENAVRSSIGWQRSNNTGAGGWDRGSAGGKGSANALFDFNETSMADPSLTRMMGIKGHSKVEAKITGGVKGLPFNLVKKFLSDPQVTPPGVVKGLVQQVEARFLQAAGVTGVKRDKMGREGERLQKMQKAFAKRGGGASGGYIPNFADANRMREAKQAGVSYGQTYYADVNTPNFAGTVVGNRRDEPTPGALKQAVNNHPNPATAGMANAGFVPNFMVGAGGNIGAGAGMGGGMSFSGADLSKLTTSELVSLSNSPGFKNVPGIKEELARRSGGFGRAAVGANKFMQTGVGQKLSGGVNTMFGGPNAMMKGMGYMMAAPMLGNMIAESVGDETTTSRGVGAIATGAGRTLSNAAMANMLGGGGMMGGGAQAAAGGGAEMAGKGIMERIGVGKGGQKVAQTMATRLATAAGVGATSGGGTPLSVITTTVAVLGTLAMEVPKVVDAFTNTMPDLKKAFDQARDANQKFQNSANSLLQITQKLTVGFESLTDREKKLLFAQQERAASTLEGPERKEYAAGMKNNDVARSALALQLGKEKSQRKEDMAKVAMALGGLGQGDDRFIEQGQFFEKRGGGSMQQSMKWYQGGSRNTTGKLTEIGQQKLKTDIVGGVGQLYAGLNADARAAMKKQMEGIKDIDFSKGLDQAQLEKYAKAMFDPSVLDKAEEDARKAGKSDEANTIKETQTYLKQFGSSLKDSAGDNDLVSNDGKFLRMVFHDLKDLIQDKLIPTTGELEKNTIDLAASMSDTIETMNKNVRDLTAGLNEHMVGLQMSSDAATISMDLFNQSTTAAQTSMIQFAGLSGAGPETTGKMTLAKSLSALQRSQAQASKTLAMDLSKSLQLAIGQQTTEGLKGAVTKFTGATLQPNSEERFGKMAKSMSELVTEIGVLNNAFKGGTAEGIAGTQAIVAKLETEILRINTNIMNQATGAAEDKPKRTQLASTVDAITSQLNKYKVQLNKIMLQTDKNIKLEIQKYTAGVNLQRLQRKINVGGGAGEVLRSQTGIQDAMADARLQYGAATSGVGRAQARMGHGDLMTKYGAEVPEGMKGEITAGLAEQMRRDFAELGLSEPTGGFQELAKKQMNNRFKTEKDIDKLVAQIENLTPGMDELAKWGQNPDRAVTIKNIDAIAAAIKKSASPTDPTVAKVAAGARSAAADKAVKDFDTRTGNRRSSGNLTRDESIEYANLLNEKAAARRKTAPGGKKTTGGKKGSAKSAPGAAPLQAEYAEWMKKNGKKGTAADRYEFLSERNEGMGARKLGLETQIAAAGQSASSSGAAAAGFRSLLGGSGGPDYSAEAAAHMGEAAAATLNAANKNEIEASEKHKKLVDDRVAKYEAADKKYLGAVEEAALMEKRLMHTWVRQGPAKGTPAHNELLNRVKSDKVYAGNARGPYTPGMSDADQTILANRKVELARKDREDTMYGNVSPYQMDLMDQVNNGSRSSSIFNQSGSGFQEIQSATDERYRSGGSPIRPLAPGNARDFNPRNILTKEESESNTAQVEARTKQHFAQIAYADATERLAEIEAERCELQAQLWNLEQGELSKQAGFLKRQTDLREELKILLTEETHLKKTFANKINESPLDQKVVKDMLASANPYAGFSKASALKSLPQGRAFARPSFAASQGEIDTYKFDIAQREKARHSGALDDDPGMFAGMSFADPRSQGANAERYKADAAAIEKEFRTYLENIKNVANQAEGSPWQTNQRKRTTAAGYQMYAGAGYRGNDLDKVTNDYEESVNAIYDLNLGRIETEKKVLLLNQKHAMLIDTKMNPQLISFSRIIQEVGEGVKKGAYGAGGPQGVGAALADKMRAGGAGAKNNQLNNVMSNFLGSILPKKTPEQIEELGIELETLRRKTEELGYSFDEQTAAINRRITDINSDQAGKDWRGGKGFKDSLGIASANEARMLSPGGLSVQEMLYGRQETTTLSGNRSTAVGEAGFGSFSRPPRETDGLKTLFFGQSDADKQRSFQSSLIGGFGGTAKDVQNTFGAGSQQADDMMLKIQQFAVHAEASGMSMTEMNMRIQSVNNSISQGLLAEKLKIAGELYEEGNMTSEQYIAAMGDAATRMRAGAEHGFGFGMEKGFTFNKDDEARWKENSGEQMASALKSNMKEAFSSMIDGSKTAKEALADFSMSLLEGLSDQALDYFINKAFSGLGIDDKTPKPKGGGKEMGAEKFSLGAEKFSQAVTPLPVAFNNFTAALQGHATQLTSVNTSMASAAKIQLTAANTQLRAANRPTTQGPSSTGAGGTEALKAEGGLIKKFSAGGPVTGGVPNTDSVRADLEPGEFVLRKGAVDQYGSKLMERLNLGAVPMAKGGSVGEQEKGGDARASVFKSQYLNSMGPVIKDMSYVELKRHAEDQFGQLGGSGRKKKAIGGIMMAASIGMGLYGAANQPDAEEIRASSGAGAKRRGSQDFSETEFRRGFGAKTATRIQKLEHGIDSIAANAAVFEGGDPRNPTSVRELTGLGKTHSARAYGGGGSQKTAMDNMREKRVESYDTFKKGQEEVREEYKKAQAAHKREKTGVLIDGLMSAAFMFAMDPGLAGGAAPADATSTPHKDPKMAGHNVFGDPSGGGINDALGGVKGGSGDTVPAMLMPGEYVINAAATKNIGKRTLDAINGGSYNPRRARGYAQGGYVAPDTGGAPAPQMGNLGGSEEAIMQLKDLVTATTSVREAIEALGQVMTQPTMQGQALEAGTVGAATGAGQTNNISISVNVEGGEKTKQGGGSSEGGGGDDTDKKENLQEMEGFAELLETSIMKVIMEQKRPGGLLYNPNNRSGF